MYLNSGDQGTHPLEPDVTTVRSAFRQELEIPLTLSQDWQVALVSMYYTHSFGNAVLKLPADYHCQVGRVETSLPLRSIQLSRHQQFTHVKHVLQDLVQRLGLYVFPTLSGGTHHYGQLHMNSPKTFDRNFPTNPKLDYFRRDVVDAWLATDKILPTTFLDVKRYLNQATRTLMGSHRVKYVWALKDSPHRPRTHYAIDLWAEGQYDLGESLALLMGFLEMDPDHRGALRIPPHNTVYANTGNNTRTRFEVTRLLDPLGGVRISLDIHPNRRRYMFGKRLLFDVGAWHKSNNAVTPYAIQEFPVTVFNLEPGRWLLQVQPKGYVRFDHGLEELMGTHVLKDGESLLLPEPESPIGELVSLSNTDLSKCFVEVDIVGLSMTGEHQRHTLAVVPFQSQMYGKTCEYHPQHVDFRPLGAPTRHLNQLRVNLRNSDNLGIPFYTGLVGLLLYFHKGPALSPTMRFQGGRRVTLESNAQLDLFPDNSPSHFRVRLPERWSLDETWEVGLFQLLLPHTWRNVLNRQVGLRIHYDQDHPDVRMFIRAGTYVTVQDVVEGWMQAMEANAPQKHDLGGLKVTLDERGFNVWTFPSDDFSVYLPAWLARVLGYLDFDSWTVPFYFHSDTHRPIVEITKRNVDGKPTEVEITRSHTMAKHSQASVWSTISKYSFQNMWCGDSDLVFPPERDSIMPVKKRFAPSQWVQVGGGTFYDQGTPAYQEGGFSPLWALAGQEATSLGKAVACKAAKRFRQSYCQDTEQPVKKKKKKRQQEGGYGFDEVAWQMIKGLGKAGTKAARLGAGKAIQSDLAQKKAMELVSPFVGQALDTLGDKVAGQQGGILPLLGLIPSLVKQLGGTGTDTYRSGTEPYQEGGFLSLLGLMPSLLKNQKGSGKRKRPKVITGASTTLNRLFRRQGGRNVGVLPEIIPGPQVGMGRRRRPGQHCFQGLP
ncbi:hypothetical protein ACROYT_G035937 [Oculina patagonica]